MSIKHKFMNGRSIANKRMKNIFTQGRNTLICSLETDYSYKNWKATNFILDLQFESALTKKLPIRRVKHFKSISGRFNSELPENDFSGQLLSFYSFVKDTSAATKGNLNNLVTS